MMFCVNLTTYGYQRGLISLKLEVATITFSLAQPQSKTRENPSNRRSDLCYLCLITPICQDISSRKKKRPA